MVGFGKRTVAWLDRATPYIQAGIIAVAVAAVGLLCLGRSAPDSKPAEQVRQDPSPTRLSTLRPADAQ